MTTDARLDEIEARANAATLDEWQSQGHSAPEDGVGVIAWPKGLVGKGSSNGIVAWASLLPTEIDEGDTRRAEANADFIAHSRADIPYLISEVRRLRTALAACVRAMEPFAWFAGTKQQTISAFPDHMPITAGSGFARRQLTMGECRAVRDAVDEVRSAIEGKP